MYGLSYFMPIGGFSNGHKTDLWRTGKRVKELEREAVKRKRGEKELVKREER